MDGIRGANMAGQTDAMYQVDTVFFYQNVIIKIITFWQILQSIVN